MSFRKSIAAAIFSMLVPLGAAWAQDYPTKPIRLILPFPPGGGTDSVARAVAEGLTKHLGQSVVIEAKPGAAGNLATEFVAHAEPDGYTILLTVSTSLVVNPSIYGNFPVDVAKELEPISTVAEAEHMLVVNPTIPANTLSEFIDYAKANPGKLNYSSSGIGTPPHLAGALLEFYTGIKMTHVTYKGGGLAVAAVLSNEVQFTSGSVNATGEQVKAGKLHVLAVTGRKRLSEFPDVPTVAEAGIPDFDLTVWYGIFAPAGTPPEVLDLLNKTMVSVAKDPATAEMFKGPGLLPISSGREELATRIASETKTWSAVVNKLGIHVD
jgi:tripartite-type tricarboxylate transporter receptor subunit TctC